jgi:hypothetical protein
MGYREREEGDREKSRREVESDMEREREVFRMRGGRKSGREREREVVYVGEKERTYIGREWERNMEEGGRESVCEHKRGRDKEREGGWTWIV